MADFRHEGETYDVAIPGSGLGTFETIHALVGPLPPVHGWGDPHHHHLDFTPAPVRTPREELAIAMA